MSVGMEVCSVRAASASGADPSEFVISLFLPKGLFLNFAKYLN